MIIWKVQGLFGNNFDNGQFHESEFRPSYRTTQTELGRVVKTENVVDMARNNFVLGFNP